MYQIPFDLYGDSLGVEVMVPGKGQGCLAGGNLSLICAAMGSPYEIQTNGKLLFMEDIGEAPYRIDRYLRELKLAGKLDRVAGVILGSFARRKEKPPDKPGDFTMEEVLEQYFKNFNVPVVKIFPPAMYGPIFHCRWVFRRNWIQNREYFDFWSHLL
jgi:muramoyltetrapeptide carboxypeptidase